VQVYMVKAFYCMVWYLNMWYTYLRYQCQVVYLNMWYTYLRYQCQVFEPCYKMWLLKSTRGKSCLQCRVHVLVITLKSRRNVYQSLPRPVCPFSYIMPFTDFPVHSTSYTALWSETLREDSVRDSLANARRFFTLLHFVALLLPAGVEGVS